MSDLPTRLVRIGTLSPGDLVGATDDPNGPLYPVIRVNPKSLVLDGDQYHGTPEAEPLPVRFPVSPDDLVRMVVR